MGKNKYYHFSTFFCDVCNELTLFKLSRSKKNYLCIPCEKRKNRLKNFHYRRPKLITLFILIISILTTILIVFILNLFFT